MECPGCRSSHTEVLESRLCINGTRRRRHSCLTCGYRWTIWEGERPDRSEISKSMKRRPARRPASALTAAQVRQALLDRDEGHHAMGRRLGRSPEAIRQLRYGITHKNIHPEIARWGQATPATTSPGPSCYTCGHWRTDRCSFGFPEPGLEGPDFAADCDLYAA